MSNMVKRFQLDSRLLTVYNLQIKKIKQTPLDPISRIRLIEHTGKMFKSIPTHKNLEHSKQIINNLKAVQVNSNKNSVKELLSIAFVEQQPASKRFPPWLLKFLSQNVNGAKNERLYVSQYGAMIEKVYAISAFKKHAPELVEKYNKSIKENNDKQMNSLVEILESNKVLYNISVPTKLEQSSEFDLFRRLKKNFSGNVDINANFPDLSIHVPFTGFPDPLTPKRIDNLIFKQLCDVRKFLWKNQPLSQKDFKYFEDLLRSDFFRQNPGLKSPYNLFLKRCYTISDDATIILPRAKISPVPDDLKEYFNFNL